jgi:hypothetical protein
LNLDILFSSKYGQFGKTIFPLRLLMMTVAPPLTFLWIFLLLAFAYTVSLPAMGILLAAAVSVLLFGIQTNMKIPNLIASFLFHQIYLLAGFLLFFKKMNVWQHIERVQS